MESFKDVKVLHEKSLEECEQYHMSSRYLSCELYARSHNCNSFKDVRLDVTMALKIEVEDGGGGVAAGEKGGDRFREDFEGLEVERVKSESWEKFLEIPPAARKDAVYLGLLLLDENGISYPEEDISVGFIGGRRSETEVGDCYTATANHQ
ncbi:hypothetical protein HN51_029661 [Arachis hypogaea]